jgi:hypothetical protein
LRKGVVGAVQSLYLVSMSSFGFVSGMLINGGAVSTSQARHLCRYSHI